MRSVSFSDGGLRDRDIIIRDEKDLVFCFLGCVVKFPTRLTQLTQLAEKGEVESWQLSVYLFFLFPLPPVLAFFHDQTHTVTRKVRRHAERPKGDREQFASLDFWITD